MKESDVKISSAKGVCRVKIEGRANFEYGPPLRTLSKSMDSQNFTEIIIDLKNCASMDSTFMGILAMMGLKAKKLGAKMTITNISPQNLELLKGLGVEKLFEFATSSNDEEFMESLDWQDSGKSDGRLATAETVVEAHDTLMEVDQKNVPKFEKVVDYARKDLEKMRENEKNK